MIGKCPFCNIELSKPPIDKKSINEMLLIIEYRKKLDSGGSFQPVKDLGYCELCNSTIEEINSQIEIPA